MNNINIQTLREMIKDKDYDVQFYADYWTYLPEGEEFQTDRDNEIEIQSNLKHDVPDHAEQHDPFEIDIDQWPQIFDDSLEIDICNYNYDQECMTIECTLESSDGTYVNCYIGLDNSSVVANNDPTNHPEAEQDLIIEDIIKKMLFGY